MQQIKIFNMFPKIGLYFFKNGSFYLSGNEIISFIYDDTPLLAMLTRVIALIIIYMSFSKIEYFCGIKKKALIFIGKRKKISGAELSLDVLLV